MASIDYTRPVSTGFGATLRRAFSTLTEWNDQRVTRKALNKLSAHELDDIGLCTGDIEAISRKVSQF